MSPKTLNMINPQYKRLTESEISSGLLDAPRKVWVQPPIPGDASDCLIFLDAEIYIERVQSPGIVHDLQAAGQLPSVASVYLSFVDNAARHGDFTCNEKFALFIATDLCRWIEQTVGTYQRLFLCGLSLSGLQALFTAIQHPQVFSGVLSQSPSAWWNDEWLAASLPRDGVGGRYWISVGNQELQEGVSHPPTGLFQKTSQMASVGRLSDKLKESKNDVRYNEFSGGHDPVQWAEELPQALRWLIKGGLTKW